MAMSESPTLLSLTAVFEPVDDGWVQAHILELPGVITVAPSREEAKELLVDALREFVLAEADVRRAGLNTTQSEIAVTATTEPLTLSVA
ncbi:MAG: hypothetical protein J7513_16890 [Solirubrobacteraceae bacterium]|nr:hypothetical protein [Solirubrobacteraceae bacterium]